MPDDIPVIALVAPPGDVDGLNRVLAPLPAAFPAAFIAVQLGPPPTGADHAVALHDRTALDVWLAEDGAHLYPGVVHVPPSSRHVVVLPGEPPRLGVSDALPPDRPAADLLITSLAVSAGPAAIVVLLSPDPTADGTAGALAVHRVGGTVITVRRAADPNRADIMVAIDDIAGLLSQIVTDTS